MIKFKSIDEHLRGGVGVYRCLECGVYQTDVHVILSREEAMALVLAGAPVYDGLCSDACLRSACRRDWGDDPGGEDE